MVSNPNSTPLDFFWELLKSKIFITQLGSITDLQWMIINECANSVKMDIFVKAEYSAELNFSQWTYDPVNVTPNIYACFVSCICD